MIRNILRDAYTDLLVKGLIGPGAGQVAEGDHSHGIWKKKTANTTISNDDTLNLDPHLQGIALPVGSYRLRAMLLVRTKAAQDFKYQWTLSGGSVGLETILARAYSEADALIYNEFLSFVNFTRNVPYPADITASKPIIFDGIIEVVAAGTLDLHWAQVVAAVTDTILFANSYVLLSPLP